ncbi:haloacid dehalogenase, partial [Bosea sp. CER48]
DAFFRSFYARFSVSPALAKLKQELDPEGFGSFMPHVSLLYGPVEPTAKAAAIAEVNTRLAGRTIRFDRIGIVTSGQDIPIADWRVVASIGLRAA